MVPSKSRPELVARIRAKGESQREIAATAGVGVGTVNRDLNGTGVPNGTPPDDDVIDAEVIEDDEAHVNRETGEVTDGPASTPEPPKSRRNPLTDQARDAGWDLRKSVAVSVVLASLPTDPLTRGALVANPHRGSELEGGSGQGDPMTLESWGHLCRRGRSPSVGRLKMTGTGITRAPGPGCEERVYVCHDVHARACLGPCARSPLG